MNSVVTIILSVLVSVLPLIKDSEKIAKIIEALITLIPMAAKVAQELIVPIRNIIAALKANPEATAELLKQLEELDAKVDAEFEAAAAAAIKEDAQAEAEAQP